MDTKKLRQKILDLAIHGKLVPQDPNDEPASVLLERIRAEKERLIKEGKIKRSKKSASDMPRYESDAPFEVPESWEWTTIEEISEIITGSTPSKSNAAYYGGIFPFYKPADLDAGRHVTKASEYLSEEGKVKSRIVPANSIAVCCIGSIGKTGYIEKEGTTNQQINTIIPSNILLPLYLYYYCSSELFIEQLSIESSAITISIVNKRKLGKIQISLPPLSEQRRIVDVIEKWFIVVDELEANQNDLQSFIKQTKSKILNLAIHGKIVPQDQNDEPAIELLKRINPSFVPCDNAHYPYDIPSGWTVCALEDVIDYEQPQEYIVRSTDYRPEYETPVLTAGKSFIIGYTNETDGICSNLPVIIFDDFTTDSKYVNFPFKVKSSAMKILHVKHEIDIQYVCYFMSITRLVGDTHKRYWISEYSKIPILIPPRKEQERIVNRINELFMMLDNISAEL